MLVLRILFHLITDDEESPSSMVSKNQYNIKPSLCMQDSSVLLQIYRTLLHNTKSKMKTLQKLQSTVMPCWRLLASPKSICTL